MFAKEVLHGNLCFATINPQGSWISKSLKRRLKSRDSSAQSEKLSARESGPKFPETQRLKAADGEERRQSQQRCLSRAHGCWIWWRYICKMQLKVNGSQINGNQVQCRIFSTTFNPEGLRLGNKVLRQRLKGPALASYYPRKMATIQDLQRLYAEHLEIMDEDEEDRFEKIKM